MNVNLNEELTNLFWDCECPDKYIHHAGIVMCLKCGATQEEQPNSHRLEVLKWLGIEPDMSIKFHGEETSKGLFLSFFNGRNFPDQQMEDWGFPGPVLGPLKYVQTTYLDHIKVEFCNPDRARLFGIDPNFPELTVVQDCIKVGNFYYGDWIVFAN